MAGLALPRPGLVGRKGGNGRKIHFERIITAMRNCDLRMQCLAIPGWPPSHLSLTTYSSPFFSLSSSRYSDSAFSARLLLHFPPYTYNLGQLILSPKQQNKNPTYAKPTSSPSTLAPSTSKQTTPESGKKEKTDFCLGMQAFFCPQEHNIPFLPWGFACKS